MSWQLYRCHLPIGEVFNLGHLNFYPHPLYGGQPLPQERMGRQNSTPLACKLVADPDLELRGGPGSVLFALPAFLPSGIFLFFTPSRWGSWPPQAPPLDHCKLQRYQHQENRLLHHAVICPPWAVGSGGGGVGEDNK